MRLRENIVGGEAGHQTDESLPTDTCPGHSHRKDQSTFRFQSSFPRFQDPILKPTHSHIPPAVSHSLRIQQSARNSQHSDKCQDDT